MRILFDQGTPVPLRGYLTGHQIETVFERGWSQLKNGDLLEMAEETFDLLVTTDQNLKYQRNLSQRKIAIVVLTTTSWPQIKEQTAGIIEAVNLISPGDCIELNFR
jgi:predicted nuclease of predicted toxin-antitoxin system